MGLFVKWDPGWGFMLLTSEIQSILRQELLVQEGLHRLAQQELFSSQSCVHVCTHLFKTPPAVKDQAQSLDSHCWARRKTVDALAGIHTGVNRSSISHWVFCCLLICVFRSCTWGLHPCSKIKVEPVLPGDASIICVCITPTTLWLPLPFVARLEVNSYLCSMLPIF